MIKNTIIVPVVVPIIVLGAIALNCQSAMAYTFDSPYLKATTTSNLSALETVRRDPNLSIMVEAIEASGLSYMMRFAGNDYTIFAPSNAAFESLFQETTLTKQKLLANKPMLKILLGYHVVKSNKPMTTNELQVGVLTTYNKRKLRVTGQNTLVDDRGRVGRIIKANIRTKNGVVHVIDKVMFPVK